MIKYAANSFLGVKISYANELADLCEKLNVDIRDVVKGIGLDSRIGHQFLNPGPGFGGSCFPKDMLEFLTSARETGSQLTLVQTAMDYNMQRGKDTAKKLLSILGDTASSKTVGVLGLAYKAETDDETTNYCGPAEYVTP